MPSPVCSVSSGIVTTTVVARPPWSGSLVRVEAFEEGAERLAALPVGGEPYAGGRIDAVLGRGAAGEVKASR